jgi:type II secretory pathway pseudopilin PulG
MRPRMPRVRTDKSLASSLMRRFRTGRDDRGFVLLESVIAIGLITVIMTAMTTFFVTTMNLSAKQRAQQAAVQLADSGIQKARSLGATGAYAGRNTTAVNTQWATAPATTAPVSTWLTSMQKATDSSGSATVALPTTAVTQNINNVDYSVNYYIGWCWRTSAASGAAAACGPATSDIPLVRTVVAVTWAGQYCPSNACSYITASLLNGTADSAFNTNAPQPSAPTLNGCLPQNFAVPMLVNKNIVASGPAPGCTVVGGIPIISYSSPDLASKIPGLSLQADGTIVGTPSSANVAGASVTITVTDGFRRISSQTILIKVFDKLKATEPSVSQVAVVGRSFSVTPKAINGSLSYTWALSGSTPLPAGLAMPNATTGVITGTPTASLSTQPISLMVTDQVTGQTDPITFNLTVYGPLTLTAPPAQLSTIGAPLTLALNATGGAPGLVWTASGLPAGLAINPSTGVISGTPTAFVVTTVSVTVTDLVSIQAQTVTFQWTINAGACTTVFTAAAGSRSLTIGAHAGPATVQLILVGGGGGSGDQYGSYQESLGGDGGKVIATYVLPASATPVVLTVFVGGGGTKGHGSDTVAGGVGNNAGGKGLSGGAAGGGASTLLLGSAPLAVAGGGGGGADGGRAGSGRDGGDGSGTAAGVDGGADGGNGGLKGTNDGTTPLAGTSRGAAGTVITATGVGHGGDSVNGGGGGGGGFGPGGGGGGGSSSRDAGGGGGGAGYLSATIFGSPTDVVRGVGGGGTNPGAGGNNNSSGIPGSFSGTICGSTPTLG